MTELSLVVDALREQRLEVSEVDGTLNVAQGTGLMAHKANLQPARLLAALADAPELQAKRLAAGYASGVKAVLLEPVRSKARHWTFVESAGSVLPTIEVRSFAWGVADAAGEEALIDEIGDELVLAWTMRLSRGMRVVTKPQYDEWGVTRDRMVAAARSLLFHMTRDVDWASGDWPETVYAIRVGDGFDASRILVVEDVFYSQLDVGWRFAMPEQNILLAVSTPDATDALSEVARTMYKTAPYPLSAQIWRLERGSIIAESR